MISFFHKEGSRDHLLNIAELGSSLTSETVCKAVNSLITAAEDVRFYGDFTLTTHHHEVCLEGVRPWVLMVLDSDFLADNNSAHQCTWNLVFW